DNTSTGSSGTSRCSSAALSSVPCTRACYHGSGSTSLTLPDASTPAAPHVSPPRPGARSSFPQSAHPARTHGTLASPFLPPSPLLLFKDHHSSLPPPTPTPRPGIPNAIAGRSRLAAARAPQRDRGGRGLRRRGLAA
uniref:Uncharacterized protein n=1 Tax=Aegilops tauschii subsp. strangulata TaxID=200361 RepID=A0A452YK43_AEGTS